MKYPSPTLHLLPPECGGAECIRVAAPETADQAQM